MLDTLYVTNRGQLTIPSRIRDAMNIKEGTRVVITSIDNQIILYPTQDSETDIMKLYSSVKIPKGKSTNPDIALAQAKKLKAVEHAK